MFNLYRQPNNITKPSQLQPQEVIDICSTALGNPVADLSCCHSMNMDNDFFNVSDRLVTAFHNNDDLRFPIEQLKENVSAYYETPSSLQDPVEFILVHDQLNRHASTLAKPPNDKFNQNKVHSMLLSLKKVDPQAPCLLYTSPSPRDLSTSRMPSSA